jgi:hypothetical protein
MSRYHCSCGFAIDVEDEFGDHLRMAFTSDDDIGTDNRIHAEMTDESVRLTGDFPVDFPLPKHVCSCGFATDDTPEFDDHLLMAFIRPDSIGVDGEKHALVDTSTPDRWEWSA